MNRVDEFATGKAAATLTGADGRSKVFRRNLELNIGVVPFVGTEGNTYAMGATNIGIAINAKAKNPENAELFLEYMGTLKFTEISGRNRELPWCRRSGI